MSIKTQTHLHIEITRRDGGIWKHFSKNILDYNSRIFAIFNRRDHHSDFFKKIPQLRGVPEDATYRTLTDYTLIVDDQQRHPESITKEKANEFVDGLLSVAVKAHRLNRFEGRDIDFISNPKWQYAHWLSDIEFLSLLNSTFGPDYLTNEQKAEPFVQVQNIITFHDRMGYDSRIIFWFSSKYYKDSLTERLPKR